MSSRVAATEAGVSVRVVCGDAIERLRELPADSVPCVVTSPPYWGLRDYGASGQIGLEPTPEAWAARLVEVFREVRRCLRPDGVCFVNVGDSFANDLKWGGSTGGKHVGGREGTEGYRLKRKTGLKPKDLVGQPWLLAFALRADGWWLRSEIIWAKPNPMPESVGDRPTKSHEQVFLLTKASRYFWDATAIAENSLRAGDIPGGGSGFIWYGAGGNNKDGLAANARVPVAPARNARSVWTIATEAFSEAHFATFPTELVRRCILAGTSAKGRCPACGARWARVVETEFVKLRNRLPTRKSRQNGADMADISSRDAMGYNRTMTCGWRPTCGCDAGEPIPCTVLDPFGGSGTTGLVAEALGRDAILIELNADYCAMAEHRLAAARARRMIGDVADRDQPLAGQLGLDL